MKRIFAFVFAALAPALLAAQEADAPSAVELWQEDRTRIFSADEVDLNEFVWIARPVVVFANTDNDPRLRQQLDLFSARPQDLIDRDVLIVIDTDPDTLSPLRTRLRPRDFMLVIMGKDGQVELRKPQPWSVREISRTIDKMPLRRDEINAERAGN